MKNTKKEESLLSMDIPQMKIIQVGESHDKKYRKM